MTLSFVSVKQLVFFSIWIFTWRNLLLFHFKSFENENENTCKQRFIFILVLCISVTIIMMMYKSTSVLDDNKGLCNQRATFGGFSYSTFPGSCNQFYQCDEDGVAHLQSCAAGTFYNGEECSHASDVKCPYGSILV